jgi:hypothetical protein
MSIGAWWKSCALVATLTFAPLAEAERSREKRAASRHDRDQSSRRTTLKETRKSKRRPRGSKATSAKAPAPKPDLVERSTPPAKIELPVREWGRGDD